MAESSSFFVYILECADGTLYTGQTKNLQERLTLHASGKGAKYVRGRTPFKLRYAETFETRGEAMRRENRIKKLAQTRKEGLFDNLKNELNDIDTSFVKKLW